MATHILHILRPPSRWAATIGQQKIMFAFTNNSGENRRAQKFGSFLLFLAFQANESGE